MRLARLYSASSRLARRLPPPDHEFFSSLSLFFLSCNDVSYECENSFSPRRSQPSPRYLYCPFSFHAISPGNLSARFLSRSPESFIADLVDLPPVSRVLLFFPPPSSPAFCFLNRYPSRERIPSNPRSFGNFQARKRYLCSIASNFTIGEHDSRNFDLNVRNASFNQDIRN